MKKYVSHILAVVLVFFMTMSVVGVNAAEVNAPTSNQSADALAERGTPVKLPSDVKDGVMSNPDGQEQEKLRGAGYPLTWKTENGAKAMYDETGKRFGTGACLKVIDVSTHNNDINWTAVKNGGVDGAILRATSYAGGYIKQDPHFAKNVKGVKSTGLPFGAYLYSYATNETEALYEAEYLLNILSNNGVKPSDLTYPIYLDLEGNNYTNNISTSMYEKIVTTFINRMAKAGYTTNVYSYKSYLLNNLNSPNIHKYVSWVAQYGKTLTFDNNYYRGMYGWQYQSNGRVSGVNGDVDVSCFSESYGKNSATTGVEYQTHVQGYGWQTPQSNGRMAGTTGRSYRLEAINIKLKNLAYSGNITYRTHVQGIGWQGWQANGNNAGTSGKSLRLEAIEIKLTGEVANHYDVYYRVHAQGFGWLDWAKNGISAGTTGYSYRLEAIEIRLVAKGTAAPGKTTVPFHKALIGYQSHVQGIGWQDLAYDGAVSGTSGRAMRLEGIAIGLASQPYSGGLRYQTHVQGIGWQSPVNTSQIAGTTGRSLRLEAIRINLTGEMAKKYDIYYHVHAQGFGWMGWAKNGASAGTTGYSYRLEAIQIMIVPKGGAAPGTTQRAFLQK